MKKFFLCTISALMCIAAHSQSLYPSIIGHTYSGINKLMQDHPYVVTQVRDSFGDWRNSSKSYWEPSEVQGYKKYTGNFYWTDNAWSEVYYITDSFVLNMDNQISVAIEKIAYDYPGFSQKSKFKYSYTYNNDKKIRTLKMEEAANFNSNAYGLSSFVTLFYDQSGKRTHDSTFYNQQQDYMEYTYYQYNASGQPVAQYNVNAQTGDTTDRSFYSYDGAFLKTIYSESFDQSTDDWRLMNADSMEITNGRISNRISYALYVDGGDISIRPGTNESYTYNMDGTLAGTITKRWNGFEWINYTKLEMVYAGEKPMFGFVHYAVGNDFEETPSMQYLFNFLSGVNEQAQSNAISALFPNPASEKLNVTLNKAGTCSVFDSTGKLVEQYPASAGNLQIDLANYPNGIYYLSIRSGENEQPGTKKFIVAR